MTEDEKMVVAELKATTSRLLALTHSDNPIVQAIRDDLREDVHKAEMLIEHLCEQVADLESELLAYSQLEDPPDGWDEVGGDPD